MPRDAIARYYLPWPTPVQAAHNTDPVDLPAIGQWVTALRQQGRVAPEVTFAVTTHGDTPTGVLGDGSGRYPLPADGFLVLGHAGLFVADAHTFHRHYFDPSPPDREWVH
ncbi:hypothetical protein [Actinokineospora enzanensis]|uniref:hypothetical protein n=1 Tax=Actinokineospora enzanensis TaxID=155975 RepID=UPI00037D7FA3|nr:hypothetical protein [Actinokineospora enzanensis]